MRFLALCFFLESAFGPSILQVMRFLPLSLLFISFWVRLCALILDSALSIPVSFFFLWVRFLALTSNTFRRIDPFLHLVSLLSLIPFSSLQSLLSKVSYETLYRKHCKKGCNSHNLFLSYSLNFTLFSFRNKNKIIKNNNNKTDIWVKASWKDFKYRGRSSFNFGWIESLIVPHYT
jgi:hypothetical protein